MCAAPIKALVFCCSCEYVVLRESGVDRQGVQTEAFTRFHGNMTSEVYRSRTNRVLLQFCYRSETFSARNIQLEFTAVGMHMITQIYHVLYLIMTNH